VTTAHGPISIVWHRTDLRVRDHAAVTAAAAASRGRTVGVICIPDDPFGSVEVARGLSIPRASHRRVGHLLQAIDGLRDDWRAIGSALCVLRGEPEQAIPGLAAELGASEVHTAPGPAADEVAQVHAIEGPVHEALQALAGSPVRLLEGEVRRFVAAKDLLENVDQKVAFFLTLKFKELEFLLAVFNLFLHGFLF
jgi:deoxyribodipyrimidine photo-lyase